MVFTRKRKIVLIHGCYWHGHSCARGKRRPTSNAEYWAKKIGSNQQRDAKQRSILEATGWKVLELWECQLKKGEAAWLDTVRQFLGPPKLSDTPAGARAGEKA